MSGQLDGAAPLCGSMAWRCREQRRSRENLRTSSTPAEARDQDVRLPGATERVARSNNVSGLREPRLARRQQGPTSDTGGEGGEGSALRAGLRRLKEANVELHAQVEAANNKAEALAEKVKALEVAVLRQKEQLETSQKEAAAQRAWAESVKEEVERERARAEAAEEEARANRHWAEASKDMQGAIAKAVQEIQQRLNASEARRAELEATAGADVGSARKQISELQERLSESGKELRVAAQRAKEAEHGVNHADQHIKELRSNVARLEARLAVAEPALADAERKLLESEREQHAAHALAGELEGQLLIERRAVASGLAEGAELRRLMRELENQLQLLQQDAERHRSARDARTEDLEAQLARERAAVSTATAQAEASDTELQDTQRRCQEFQRQLHESEEHKSSIQQQLEDCQERRRKSETAANDLACKERDLGRELSASAERVSELQDLVARQREMLAARDLAEGSEITEMQLQLKSSQAKVSELELELVRERVSRDGEHNSLVAQAEDLRSQLSQQQQELDGARLEVQQLRAAAAAAARLADETRKEKQARIAQLEITLEATNEKSEGLSQQVLALQDAAARESQATAMVSELATELSRTRAQCHGVVMDKDQVMGISVRHFVTVLMDEVRAYGLDRDASVYEVEARVARQRGEAVESKEDGQIGAAYIDAFEGMDHVGPATHILSCSSDSAIGDVADALVSYCEEEGLSTSRTYVWLCSLCVNHHRARSSSGSASLRHEVLDRMTSVRKVLALMSPWDAPGYVDRRWCCVELYLAISVGSEACEVTCIAPPLQRERVSLELRAGGTGLVAGWRRLSSIRVEEARASSSQEASDLLRLVKDGPGCDVVNVTISRHLRSWMVATADLQARQLLASGELAGELAARVCDLLGWQLREAGLHQRATAMLQDGLQFSLQVSGAYMQEGDCGLLCSIGASKRQSSEHESVVKTLEDERAALDRSRALLTDRGAAVLAALGDARWLFGDTHGAVNAFNEARQARTSMRTLHTLEGALLLRSIGIVEWSRSDHPAALAAFGEAMSIYDRTNSLQSPRGVALLLNIGFAKAEGGDSSGAFAAYEQAFRLLGGLPAWQTPSGATLLSSIGVALGNQGDQLGALNAYKEARSIREMAGTLECAAGAVLLRNIGVALAAGGDPAAAADSYMEAKQIRENLGTLDTPAGANLLSSLGAALADLGDTATALRFSTQASQIYQSAGALDTPNGKSLLRQIERLQRAI